MTYGSHGIIFANMGRHSYVTAQQETQNNPYYPVEALFQHSWRHTPIRRAAGAKSMFAIMGTMPG